MLHGGEIYNNIVVRYDFSVNINPLGIPENVLRSLQEKLSLLTKYPDQECRKLRLALEKRTGVPAQQILCGNGASELIEAAVRGLHAGRILLTAPSFSGYRHAAESHGSEILYHDLRREENFALTERYLEDLAQKPDLAILCSPSNPIGNRIAPDLLVRIAETCEKQGTWLMVDECFLDLSEGGVSLRSRLEEWPGLFLLKAFTKSYGMAGLRLGYCLTADGDLLERMSACSQPWNVSVPAQAAGIAALGQQEFLARANAVIRAERPRLKAGLEELGCRVCPSEANYLLFRSRADLGEKLLKRGIALRSCANYHGLGPGWFRTAVRTREENDRLLAAVKSAGEE